MYQTTNILRIPHKVVPRPLGKLSQGVESFSKNDGYYTLSQLGISPISIGPLDSNIGLVGVE